MNWEEDSSFSQNTTDDVVALESYMPEQTVDGYASRIVFAVHEPGNFLVSHLYSVLARRARFFCGHCGISSSSACGFFSVMDGWKTNGASVRARVCMCDIKYEICYRNNLRDSMHFRVAREIYIYVSFNLWMSPSL